MAKVHHPSPIVAYHMQQRKWHQTKSNEAHQAVRDIKRRIKSEGGPTSITSKGLEKARRMRDEHQTAAHLHNKLVHHYGHSGLPSAFGRYDTKSKEFHLNMHPDED